jgi:DNA-binding IclR family transcriptional regulator
VEATLKWVRQNGQAPTALRMRFLSRNSLCADWLISQRLAETGSRQDGQEAGLRVCKRGRDTERLWLDREDSRHQSRTVSRQASGDLPRASGASGLLALAARPRAPTWPCGQENVTARIPWWPGSDAGLTRRLGATHAPTLVLRDARQPPHARPPPARRGVPGTRARRGP